MWNSGRRYPKLNADNTKGRFDGYTVLVAGGGSGIGKSAAERFANDGANVYVLDIQIPDETQSQQKFGEKMKYITLDVTDTENCQRVVTDIAKNHDSQIHTLVNSAAYFGSKGITAKKEDWERSFDVNVIGYANMVQAVVPYMLPGQSCSIINLSSISAHRAQPDRWTYSATKGAIISMTRCMALDLREKDIRVNAISPSWVWTPEVAKAASHDRQLGENKWQEFFIMDRLGDVEEIGAVIAFLASKDAVLINGADIPACGGYLAIGPEQRGGNSSFAGTKY